jgi:hypothetical protein
MSDIMRPMIDTTCPGCGLMIRVFEDDPSALPVHHRGDSWAPGVLCNRRPIPSKADSSPMETTEPLAGTTSYTGVIRGAGERETTWIKVLNLYHLGNGTVLGEWQRERLDAIMAHADAEQATLTAVIAERDATIERLWAQLNEATNVPDAIQAADDRRAL